MKKPAVLLVVLLSLFPLFSDMVPSNMLGQRVDIETDYSLETDGSVSTLYRNGIPVRTTSTSVSGTGRTITQRDLESGVETISVYRDRLLESRTVRYPDGSSEQTQFVYSDGSLVFTSYIDSRTGEEEKTTVEYYLRNPSDQSLFGVRRFEDTVLVGQSYLYDEEGNIYQQTAGMTISGEFEVTEQGNITFSRDGVQYTYGPDSRLLREESEQGITEYEYLEGELAGVTETSADGRTVVTTQYADSLPVYEISSTDGVRTQTIDYTGSSGGMIKTVYARGVPVARVYYMADNRRVLRVEYL